MIKALEPWESPQQTYFETAIVSRNDLLDGFAARFGDAADQEDVADLLLAELVRRRVCDDQSPPGGEDQLQSFHLPLVAADLGIDIDSDKLQDLIALLHTRDLIGNRTENGECETPSDEHLITEIGVHRGIALIDKFAPRRRHRDGPEIDSRKWTGLQRRTINSSNREQVIIAINQAMALVDKRIPDNAIHAQAIGYLVAAKALVEVPEPPGRLIWELINRAGAVTGLISFFITIFTAAQ